MSKRHLIPAMASFPGLLLEEGAVPAASPVILINETPEISPLVPILISPTGKQEGIPSCLLLVT